MLCLVLNSKNKKLYAKKLADAIRVYLQQQVEFIPSPCSAKIPDQLERQGDYAMANLLKIHRNCQNLFHYETDGIHFLTEYPLIPDTSLFSSVEVRNIGNYLFIKPQYTYHIQAPEFYIKQKKLFEIFYEYDHWVSTMEIHYLDRLNNILKNKEYREVININEAFHEKKLTEISRMIYDKKETQRIVLIAGPSSSGKTTFSKRLSLHLRTFGLKAISLSLDNYYVNNDQTPLDEEGQPDFESIEALDLELLNEHLLELLDGKTIDVPHFDFKRGIRDGTEYQLQIGPQDILIIEGIHGLNDRLTAAIPPYMKFKIYISPITPLNIDHYHRLSSSDNRLLRRIVRDKKYRNHSALETLEMWNRVRRGEEKNIFPYQEEADVMFNSALIYELSVLKLFALDYLKEVPEDRIEYCEASRHIQLLQFVDPFPDLSVIPPTSILREFIGGSTISY